MLTRKLNYLKVVVTVDEDKLSSLTFKFLCRERCLKTDNRRATSIPGSGVAIAPTSQGKFLPQQSPKGIYRRESSPPTKSSD